MKKLVSLGGLLSVNELVEVLTVQSDAFIILSLIDVAALAIYTPAMLFSNAVRMIVAGLARQLRPMATDYYVTGQHEKLRELLLRSSRVNFLMGIPFLVVFTCFGGPIVKIWLGAKLGTAVEITGWVLVIRSIVDYSFVPGQSHHRILTGMDRVHYTVGIRVVLGAVKFGGSILLVWWMRELDFGNYAVLGAMLPNLVTVPTLMAFYAIYVARSANLSLRRFGFESYVRPLLVAAGMTVLGITLRVLFDPESIVSTGVCIFATCLLWIPLSWYVGIDEGDRNRIRGLLASLMRRYRSARGA